ncbi:Formyltransferase/hydrolase complex subunit D [Polystyrenella longa]|uniref:Formyltransferase/hydrolase complex subunit D n=1 Tax=Polystyrenella longa TaxID=2528007 RepID=A0A518CHD6_9PLAN|nr:formylmethanofuran--tetrahydromethanopterin N-formyltransferase [Polystyrenella longa]QDU78632.1 Formyltransferase/hydrolase complex subunit D [Polystyrenella longa]
MFEQYQCEVEDTYAEAFRSLYAEFLITARDRKWLNHALYAATGHASSTIMCDCEAGLDRYVGPGGDESFATPDGRPGAIVQLHVPRFRKDRVPALEKALLSRVSQNVLTCPTTACFNMLESEDYYRLGRKVSYFGDGHEFLDDRHGRKMWVIPTMGGEFSIDRRFGYSDGIMGGNLWFMGTSEEAAITAAERAVEGVEKTPGTITTFPGGVAASASKAGSKYKFLFASTFAEYCPTLKEKLGEKSLVPEGVTSIQEIIINGRDLDAVAEATYAAMDACHDTPGLVKISAGNYNGRLGKSFIYLDRNQQPAS